MKRNVLIIVSILLSATVFAQQFDKSKLRAGVGFVYATEIANIGVTLNGVYSFTEQWEACLGFSHIFEKDYLRYNVVDLDAHYVFYRPNEKFNIYGLAGFGFTFWKASLPAMNLGNGYSITEFSEDGTEGGLNLGVGINYKLSNRLNLSPEIRYTIMDGSYLRFGASLQYLF